MRPPTLLRALAASATLLLPVATTPAEAPPSPAPHRRFAATTPDEALAWQRDARRLLARALRLEDLLSPRQGGIATNRIPLDARELRRERHTTHERLEIEFHSTATRRIQAIVTLPLATAGNGPHPAVVCIHGHGGNRAIVHDPASIYRGFAHTLASTGFVTISTDVGQHTVNEPDRTLMGERLWDLVRCVDYLESLPRVDGTRLGCAGLSLGGEMALWLGAMDDRMKATVSSGFLTTVANLRQGHCPCWDFPGLTDNFDFSDIYSLIAPRPLLCQNGRRETAPGGFPVEIAQAAMGRIRAAYAVWNAADRVQLDTPDTGHVLSLDAPIPFLSRYLRP